MGEARYETADRAQLRWDLLDLESLLPADHRARVVWAFAEGLDLSVLYDRIRARAGEPGRPPPDPRIMMALWLYATLEGVGSARQVARLCESDVAYRWLCGGVAMNYHGLSDFRVAHGDVLDGVLSESLAAMLAQGLVKLAEVALDGTKVRASAGHGSFHRGSTLAAQEALARQRVAALKAECDADPAASSRRQTAARQRAAAEVAQRAAAAQRAVEQLRAEKAERAKRDKAAADGAEPRASLTDAQPDRCTGADHALSRWLGTSGLQYPVRRRARLGRHPGGAGNEPPQRCRAGAADAERDRAAQRQAAATGAGRYQLCHA